MDVGQNMTFRTRRESLWGADRPRVARTDSKTKEGSGSSLHATAPADESGVLLVSAG